MATNKVSIVIGIILLAIVVLIFVSLQNPNASPDPNTLGALPTGTEQTLSSPPTQAPLPTTDLSPVATAEATSAILTTSKGKITIELYQEDARQTIANFVNKAQSGFYNNLTFHRVEDWVVQGGDPKGNGTGGGNMPVEFNDRPFIVGSVGVASRGDGKVQNDAQFFITKQESPHLNGKYTNFGIVTDGMDVVEKIQIGDKILQISTQ